MNERQGVTVQGVIHWAIPVNDLDESARFYTTVLGMEDAGPVGPRMHCVKFGGAEVLLCRHENRAEGSQDSSGSIHIAFRVEPADFDRAAAHMREWGVDVRRPSGTPDTIKGDVEHRGEGTYVGRSLYFNDPSGNRLEIHDPAPRT
jgi:catechol 2,3-dioxygenase-like lactoylglutathione lyase family enzyme